MGSTQYTSFYGSPMYYSQISIDLMYLDVVLFVLQPNVSTRLTWTCVLYCRVNTTCVHWTFILSGLEGDR